MHYCHCPWACAAAERISPTYCHCGGGYFKQLWEAVLEKPVNVELVRSVVAEDECCEFLIHLLD